MGWFPHTFIPAGPRVSKHAAGKVGRKPKKRRNR